MRCRLSWRPAARPHPRTSSSPTRLSPQGLIRTCLKRNEKSHGVNGLNCCSLWVKLNTGFYNETRIIRRFRLKFRTNQCSISVKGWPIVLSVFMWNWSRSTVADPGFPRGGGANSPGGCTNIRFCWNFPKTAWNWKNLDPRGMRIPCDPLRTATGV